MSTPATSPELRGIASILDGLNNLDESLRVEGADVSFSSLELFDVNGDSLGHATFHDGLFVFQGAKEGA